MQVESGAVVAGDMNIYTTEAFQDDIMKHFKDKEGYIGTKDIVRQQEYDKPLLPRSSNCRKETKRWTS